MPPDSAVGAPAGDPTGDAMGAALDHPPADTIGELPVARDPVDAAARELLDRLTLHEKLHLLTGDTPALGGLIGLARRGHEPPYVAGAVPRLGITGVRYTDGPRGVAVGQATAFPVPMARAASFDLDLEERIGDAIGVEARALGANLFGGVSVDLLHHPAWGRAQDTYGEDPHVVGEMAAALVRGVQRHVMACARHLACYAMEDARYTVDVRVDADDLRDVYLPPARRVVNEGVAAIMTAYHRVNGELCGHHRELITDVLKGTWDFGGFVVGGLVLGVRSADAVNAGVDLELPFRMRFRGLGRLVRRGRVAPERIDDAALRILRQQVRFGALGDGALAAALAPAKVDTGAAGSVTELAAVPPDADTDDAPPVDDPAAALAEAAYGSDRVASAAHRSLAREAAERSLVLLRNRGLGRVAEPETMDAGAGPVDDAPTAPGPAAGLLSSTPAAATTEWRRVLPLDPGSVESLTVFGRLAALPVTGDRGSSQVRAPSVVTVLDGLAALGERHVIDVDHEPGDDLVAAGLAAAKADAVVVVVGYTDGDEGERLPRLLARADGRSTRGGDRAHLTLRPHDERLVRTVAAANRRTIVVLIGGSAIVTEAWREQVGAILVAWYPGMEGGHAVARALFGEVNPGGRLPSTWPRSAEQLPPFDPTAAVARFGPLHGYRLMQAAERAPAFPFGFGLSYTTFEHGRLTGRRAGDGTITVTVPVTNTGTRVGDEVVQVYLDEPRGSDPRPLRTLRGVRRVTVAPGATVNVTLPVPAEAARRAQFANGGTLVVHVGRSADPRDQRSIEI